MSTAMANIAILDWSEKRKQKKNPRNKQSEKK